MYCAVARISSMYGLSACGGCQDVLRVLLLSMHITSEHIVPCGKDATPPVCR
jgi:hypothetical protein